jgi:urease subunit gamma/beta
LLSESNDRAQELRAEGHLPYNARGDARKEARMHLTPTELDRLTIFTAAELARRRRARGWKLTHPEALAIICDEMHEAARGGASYEEVARVGGNVLTANDVLDGVPELVGTVKIECLFGDGMRVLQVDQAIARPGVGR